MKKTRKYLLSLFTAFVVMISLVVPKAYGEEATNLGSGIFKDASVKIGEITLDPNNVTEIELNEPLQVHVTFNWAIDDDKDLSEPFKAGDWAELQLPGSIKGVVGSATGILQDDEGQTVGTYEISTDGKLKVVFNDELEGLEDRKGTVWMLLEFDVANFEDDVNQRLDFGDDIGKNFELKVNPTENVHSIQKFGEVDEKINPSSIDWQIDVNTKLESLADALVEDIIPEGLTLDPSSIKIHELTVGSKGKLTLGSEVTDKTITETDSGFKVVLGETDKAYRITYTTSVETFKSEYTNNATLKDGDALKAQDDFKVDGLSRGSLIEKSGKRNSNTSDKVTWTIDVNKSEATLNDVVVKDDMPAGFKDGFTSFKVYKLKKAGDNWQTDGPALELLAGFPLDLGGITGAYRIVFEKEIDYTYFTEYNKEIKYINEATLEVEGENVDTDDDTVTITRGTLLEKSGTEVTNYGDSILKWTISVNKAKHVIPNATITDTYGDGLEYITNTFVVKNSAGTIVDSSEYTVTHTSAGFTLDLGTISSAYTIEYQTKITKELPEGTSGYSNKAELGGGNLGGEGVGEGDLEKNPTVTPSKTNTYAKNVNYFEQVGGVTYNGLDYENKTISWQLTVDALKEEIANLKITDTFEPAKSLYLLEDTLRIKVGETILVKDTDYTLTDNGVDGFSITFIGAHVPLERAKYEIFYKTSFEVNSLIEKGGTPNTITKYTNHASFTGQTKDVEGNLKPLSENKHDDIWVAQDYVNSGKKDGTIDRENRTIAWKIYTNAQSQDLLGAPFIITDTLSGNQTINKDVKVYEYKLATDGSQVKVSEITSGFVVSYDEENEKGFTLTFEGGVDKPILVEFSSKINGISAANYRNDAEIKDKTGLDKNYDKTVTYEYHQDFVRKNTAASIPNNQVFTDEEIEWEIVINNSLSDINDAIFKDVISEGHVLIHDSIKVYKTAAVEENELTLMEGAVSIVENDEGETEFSINLGNIKERYIITYKTVVIATSGKISNQASLTGKEGVNSSSGKLEYTATQTSGGTGSGVQHRGSITITKVDEDGETITLPATFELYYLLNGEKRTVADGVKVTSDGKLEYTKFPNRTYYLAEVEAPEGYKLLSGPIEIVIDKDHQEHEFNIENIQKTYAIGDYTWIDANKDGIQDADEAVLAGVIVELYDENGHKLRETTTDKNGRYIFDELPAGKYKVKFTLTDQQAAIYKFTSQNTGDENSTNDSDANPETGWTIVIDLGDDNENLTKDYDIQDFKATEGIDPTWDAGVILQDPPTTNISVQKVWIGQPLESIKVYLYENGTITDKYLTLSAENDWKDTFENLPTKYIITDEDEIVYTIKEELLSEYYVDLAGSVEDGFVLTNTQKTYAIGDYTWIDANKDGIQDADEAVLAGVIVELYDENGHKLRETTTDKNGRYIFDELPAGKYQVKFTLTDQQAAIYKFTSQNTGDENSTNDSDANPETGWTVVITLGDTNTNLTKKYDIQDFKATEGIDPTWDAGVILLDPPTVDIPVEKVWIGQALESIKVYLYENGEITDKYLTLSAENDWKDTFENLPTKYIITDEDEIVYTIKEELLSEYYVDLAGSVEDGFVLTNTQKTYAIGDYTWIDANKDGVQDANEAVLAGVIVELYDLNGHKLRETTTDKNGRYIFDELPAGKYQVKFTLTKEQAAIYEFTTQNTGNNTSSNDSDANPITGWTVVITLGDTNTNLTKKYDIQDFKATEGIDPTWDAGVIVKATDSNSDSKLPTTGSVSLAPVAMIFIAASGLFFGLSRRYKKD